MYTKQPPPSRKKNRSEKNTSSEPRPPALGGPSISAGDQVSCFRYESGAVECWGDATWGAVDPDPSLSFETLSTGWYHHCGMADPGTGLLQAACWGNEAYGRTLVPPASTFIDVAAGEQHSAGVTDAGTLECWGGTSFYGQCDSIPRQTCMRRRGGGLLRKSTNQ